MRVLFFLVGLVLIPPNANADCASPAGVASQTRYDSGVNKLYYCNDTNWVEMGGGGGGASSPTCQAGNSNPQIGNVCDDGSIFLGSHPNYSWQGFYASSSNSSSSNQFGSVSRCSTLNRHGHSDWYLPTKSEMHYLYEYRNAIGTLGTTDFWTSTTATGGNAWLQNMNDGIQSLLSQAFSRRGRCVRRG